MFLPACRHKGDRRRPKNRATRQKALTSRKCEGRRSKLEPERLCPAFPRYGFDCEVFFPNRNPGTVSSREAVPDEKARF